MLSKTLKPPVDLGGVNLAARKRPQMRMKIFSPPYSFDPGQSGKIQSEESWSLVDRGLIALKGSFQNDAVARMGLNSAAFTS